METFNWIMEHGLQIAEILFGVMGVASLVTALTPTPKDDEIVRKLFDFFSVLKPKSAEGTLKVPFTRSK